MKFKKIQDVSLHHYNYYFNSKATQMRRKDTSNIFSVAVFIDGLIDLNILESSSMSDKIIIDKLLSSNINNSGRNYTKRSNGVKLCIMKKKKEAKIFFINIHKIDVFINHLSEQL